MHWCWNSFGFDMDTSCLLSAIAHGCIVFTLFFSRVRPFPGSDRWSDLCRPFLPQLQDEHILASLAPGQPSPALFSDLDVSLSIVLGLSLALLLLECLLHLNLILPTPFSLFCVVSHTFACIFLLKFTLDLHPTQHFWLLFSLINCPIFLGQLGLFMIKHCCPISTNKLKLC